MTGLFIALAGIWFISAGYHGNGSEALKFLGLQKKYVVWLFAILILWGLYQIKATRGIIKPLAILALITLLVKNFPAIQAEYQQILKQVNQ